MANTGEQQQASSDVVVKTPERSKPSTNRPKPKPLPQFHVILLDDDEHSFEYVIEMMQVVFAYPPERGLKIADEVNDTGRVIVFTSHRELAELKRDQILRYGADPRIGRCRGSMTAVLEPAPE